MPGFAILLLFNFLGVIANHFGAPLRGPVLGLILLALALFTGLVKLAWVEDASTFLLNHMTLFFTPVIVGVLPILPEIRPELASILITLIGSTLAVMLTTALTAKLLLPRTTEGTSHD